MNISTDSFVEHQSSCKQYVNAAGAFNTPSLLVPGFSTTCLVSTCCSSAAIARADD
jgi:hypothetical protein